MESACPICDTPGPRLFRHFSSDTFGVMREFEHRECRKCGYIFVHPQPTPAELESLYTSPRYYEMVETEALLPDGTRERPEWKASLFDDILTRMHRSGCTSGKLLDVGCGWGLFMERAVRAGFTVSGIELSPDVANYVRNRLHLEVFGTVLGEIPEKAFTVVTMMDVLEHVSNPREFLSQAFRVLQPGGWLTVNVPRIMGLTSDRLPRLVNRLRGNKENIFLQHLSEFRPNSLRTLLEQTGFTGISVNGLENWRNRANHPFPKNIAWLALSGLAIMTGMTSSLVGIARKPL